MPFYGSSNISNNLIFQNVTYITGPTGATGNIGATGSSITGPTGTSGPRFVGAGIFGYTFGITYGSSGFFFSVTGPSGSSQRITGVTFQVRQLGNPNSYSLFGGFDSTDTYKFLFKTIKFSGEVTAGISGNAIYVSSSSSVTNTNVGKTGSLFYVDKAPDNSDIINPTNDNNTNYYRSIITPAGGSNLGITLDTFTFKQKQHFDTVFVNGATLNLNWLNILNTTTLSSKLANNSINLSEVFPETNNRTDQGVFITVCTSPGNEKNLYPKISFRAEGITLSSPSTQYNPIQVDIVGKGITYSENLKFKNSIVGSCCYCSQSTENEVVNRSCVDYATPDFCESINGVFNFKTCNQRYQSDDCYSGGACCVNGICLETDQELCSKANGRYYPNVRCRELEFGCPNTCPVDETASCCFNGTCYSVPKESSGEDLCKEIGGRYDDIPCSSRNCCAEAILGSCCLDADTCLDDLTPKECKERGGVFQGAGRICTSSTCCVSVPENPALLRSFVTTNNFEVSDSLKIGDFFEGGIVAGFVGYPNPKSILGEDSIFATGQIISELENTLTNPSIKTYVPVTGVYNSGTRCNCSNFSPSRYVLAEKLATSKGKVLLSDIKSLSGVNDEFSLTFYNRLSDICLTNENRACNEKNYELKKIGFNSIQAYKNFGKQIYGNSIPSAWVLIVAPEDFGNGNVSFGMNMGVDNFSIPSGFENYNNLLWQDNLLTPYGTTIFDGYFNTRMFDETSIERNNWFIPSSYVVNNSSEILDPLAYHRFKHLKQSYWQSAIDVNKIMRDSSYFMEKYKEMWYAINTENTALYNISKKNKESYNGYSDWYIPSAVELNFIYNNLDKINNSLERQGNSLFRTISKKNNYWSSTTGGRVTKFIPSVRGGRLYQSPDQMLENVPSSNDVVLDTWKSYKLTQAHRAYTQNMSTGVMSSILKVSNLAKLRACRMIPIHIKNNDLSNQFEFSFKSLNTCSTCR